MDAVRACQRDWSAHMAELDELGYTLVPDIVPLCLAARVRAFSDDLLGAPDPAGQRRSKVHPIPGPVMAELASLPPLLSMAAHFCGCGGDDGSGALDLRLQEQVLIRTDHHSELEQPPGPTGWHIDFLFPPNSYESTPKKVYFQYFLHMSSTLPGGAAFCIVPRSHHRTIQAARQLRTPEERTTFRTNIAQNLGYNDPSAAGIEVCAPEGSCVVFNPMSLHSASNHTRPGAPPRHVVVCSFSHCREAGYLQQQTREIRYLRDWHPDMYEHMPGSLRPILENPALWGRHEAAQLQQYQREGWIAWPSSKSNMLPAQTRTLCAQAAAAAATAKAVGGDDDDDDDVGALRAFLAVLKEVGEPLHAALEEQANCALARALLAIDPAINTGPHGNIAHVMLCDVGCGGGTGGGGARHRQRSSNSEELGDITCFRHPLVAVDGRRDDDDDDDAVVSLIYAPQRVTSSAGAEGGLDIWWSYRPREHVLRLRQQQQQQQLLLLLQQEEAQTQAQVEAAAAAAAAARESARVRLAAAVQEVLGVEECQRWPERRKQFWGLSTMLSPPPPPPPLRTRPRM